MAKKKTPTKTATSSPVSVRTTLADHVTNGPAYSPGHTLVGWAAEHVPDDSNDDPFIRVRPLVDAFDLWAREGQALLMFPMHVLRDIAKDADLAKEWLDAETELGELIDGADAEDVAEFWRRLNNYVAQIVYPAMLFGLWAGANITTEAVGGALNPIPPSNITWTVARNLVRVSIERGRARH